MKTKHWFAFIFSVFAVAIVAGIIKNQNNTAQMGIFGSAGGGGFGAANGAPGAHSLINPAAPPNNSLSLITEPADDMAPVLAMINNASTSVDLVMYEFEDDANIEAALAAAARRGVAVRVLLNEGYYGVPDDPDDIANGPAYQYLRANGVAVRWTPGSFALTHQKTLVADGSVAAIMTFNFTAQYYPTSRDFGIIDRDANDVAAIESVFNTDWETNESTNNLNADADTNPNTNSAGDDLVWSPGSENAMLALINGAKTSLDVYNEEMDDDDITDALAAAARHGVVVKVVMTYSSEWKSAFQELAAAGASVRTYSSSKKTPLYIHAKMILADDSNGGATNNTISSDTIAFLGSENFSAASLDDNRELGIVFTDSAIIKSLAKIFNSDYKNATPFAP